MTLDPDFTLYGVKLRLAAHARHVAISLAPLFSLRPRVRPEAEILTVFAAGVNRRASRRGRSSGG